MIQYKIKDPPDKQWRKRCKIFLLFQPQEIIKPSNLKLKNQLPVLKINPIKNIKRVASIKNNMVLKPQILMQCVLCFYNKIKFFEYYMIRKYKNNFVIIKQLYEGT
jgi:hypothetical protein